MSLNPIAFIAPNYRDFKTWWLKAYEVGTTTPKELYFTNDIDGDSAAKLQLDADGFIESSAEAHIIPYIDGAYDAYLFSTAQEADDNDTTNAERIADNINPSELFINEDPVFNFSTLDEAVNSTDTSKIYEGAALNVSGRTIKGDGGGAMWDVVSIDEISPNGADYVALNGLPEFGVVLRDSNKLKAFGALGEGNDDTIYYLAWAERVNSKKLSSGVLVDRSRLTSDVTLKESHKIIGNGATIECDGGRFIANNEEFEDQALTQDAETGFIVISDTSNVENGDLVRIKCDTLFPYDNRGVLTYGEVAKVTNVVSSTNLAFGGVGVAAKLRFAEEYTTAANSEARIYKNKTLAWENFRQLNIGSTTFGWVITGFDSPTVTNVSQEQSLTSGAGLLDCNDALVLGGTYNRNYDGQVSSPGYGIQFNGCRNSRVLSATFTGNRRGVDFSGPYPSIGGGVYSCSADSNGGNTGSAFGAHGPSADITFEGNNLGTNEYGFIIRGLNHSVKNNKCVNADIDFIQYTDGQAIKVMGNDVNECQRFISFRQATIDHRTDPSLDTMDFEVVSGNYAGSVLRPAIGFDIGAVQNDLYGYIITNNNFRMKEGSVFRFGISGLNGGDDVSNFVFSEGCNISKNDFAGDLRFNGTIDSLMNVDSTANLNVEAIRLDQLGSITISSRTGGGTFTNLDLSNSSVDYNRGRVRGQATILYDLDIATDGMIINVPWLLSPNPSPKGTVNPLAVKTAYEQQYGNAQIRANGQLFAGNDITSIDGTYPAGTGEGIFLEFNYMSPSYMGMRYQG